MPTRRSYETEIRVVSGNRDAKVITLTTFVRTQSALMDLNENTLLRCIRRPPAIGFAGFASAPA